MRVAFYDPANWRYTIDTPYEQPLGGSQSAICYLADELAKLGLSITVFNGVEQPAESRGIQIRNLSEANARGRLNEFDAVIVVNSACGRELRQNAELRVPLILWNQHNYDRPAVHGLRFPEERESWAALAFVSEWQRRNFEMFYRVAPERSRVMRNAASPVFLDRPAVPPWFAAGRPPVLYYASTPYRGLDVLLSAFPRIREAVPGTELKIFSSMNVYLISSEMDQYKDLYDIARRTAGVEYIGSVSQKRLAGETAGMAALAYPSTFAETFCITAIEAMAAGAAVFTTSLGALPETTGGHAATIEPNPDKARLAGEFAEMTANELRFMLKNPQKAAKRRLQRMKFVRSHFTWRKRAKEWLVLLEGVLKAARPVSGAFPRPATRPRP